MQQAIPTSTIYAVYASALVTILSSLGWVIPQDTSLAIIAGIVAIIGTIINHKAVNVSNAAGLASGAIRK